MTMAMTCLRTRITPALAAVLFTCTTVYIGMQLHPGELQGGHRVRTRHSVAMSTAPRARTPARTCPLFFARPADPFDWTRAFPVGNGRMGALLAGSVWHDRIPISDDTLYSGQ